MQPKQMSAVILAGGRSSRMGENKLFMPLGEKPLIGHLIDTVCRLFAEVILVTDEPQSYRRFPVTVIRDVIECGEKNALTGIHAGLSAAKHPYVFVAAGDMPFVRAGLLRYLCCQADGWDVAIPREGGYVQPLCAVYHKNCLPVMEKHLRSGKYKVTGFFAESRVCYVDVAELLPFDPELLSFFNVNTPEDYRRAQELLELENAKGGSTQ